MGVPCYGKTPADVYWSKLADDADEPTAAMKTGNRLEGPLVDFAVDELGIQVLRNQFRVAGVGEGIPAANFDALVVGKPQAIECKYVGPTNNDQWGQSGTDECPDHVLVQCQHQMMVGNLECVWVAAAIARYQLDWVLYRVPRSEPIIKAILDAEVDFWNGHVVPKIAPDDSPPPLEILKQLRREPASTIQLDGAALETWERRKTFAEVKKIAEKDYEQATAEMLHLLGEAEAGLLPDGSTLTYFMQRGAARFDVDAFKREHPELYKEFASETSHRVLRIKKSKGDKP
jgi:predicted phage-related endonuclease